MGPTMSLFKWFVPDFGWATLAFGDKLKLAAFYVQAGGGMAMTIFASYAMYQLATMRQVWPVFYMGLAAMILVGVVQTGLAGLLIKRSVKFEVGPAKFEAQDHEAAQAMAREVVDVQRPNQ